jgi:shikimate dehydrogenase
MAGIIGGSEQVARSLSPVIHNAAFKAMGLDWRYVGFPVAADPAAAVKGLAQAGVRGLNVTMPHKSSIFDALDELAPGVESIGAVNTVEMRDGWTVGHNTDGVGLLGFLTRDLGARIAGASVLILGAGGSARAAVDALSKAGAASFTVMARDESKAAALAKLCGSARFEVIGFGASGDAVEGADVILNATPLGQKGEDLPIPAGAIRTDSIVVDFVYSPPVTPLVDLARRKGAVASSGLGMLLHQAAISFEIWTGVKPQLGVMSAAATHLLAGFKTDPLTAE